MRGVRVHLALVFIAAFMLSTVGALTSCKDDPNYGLLDPLDFAGLDAGGLPFNADNLISNEALADAAASDTAFLQKFFARTTYNRSSFLETYSSGGVRAADGIMRAARYYQINPIVLLARMQSDKGLVGAKDYPFPTERVEYAFRCGCGGPSNCDPRLAGLDKQIDCLAAQIRNALNEATDQGRTSGGWAAGATLTTLDGVAITPENAATAALYQVLPVVAEGKAGGNWIFWNILRQYSDSLNYFGPGGL